MMLALDFTLARAIVVAILAVASWQSQRAFGERGVRYVALGWSVSLLAILMSHLSTLAPPGRTLALPSLMHACDFVANGCFVTAYMVARPSRLERNQRFAALAGFMTLLCCQVLGERTHFLGDASVAVAEIVGSIAGIGALIAFYRLLLQGQSRREQYVLQLGLWMFLLAQLLRFVGTFWSPASLWSTAGGLLATTCITFGVIFHLAMAAADNVRLKEQGTRVRDLTSTIGRILHEIATPVAQIGVLSSRLADVAPSGEFRSRLQSLESARLRLAATLDAARRLMPSPVTLISLREIEKTFEGIPQFGDQQVISANTLVQLALMAVKETRAERVRIVSSYASDCCIRCQPIDVVNALVNLLRNAYDAMPDGTGVVHLATAKERRDGETMVSIAVQDDGEGIPQEDREGLFMEGVTTREGVGRGYGLSMVKDAAEKNGGMVELISPSISANSHRPGTRAVIAFPSAPCTDRWR